VLVDFDNHGRQYTERTGKTMAVGLYGRWNFSRIFILNIRHQAYRSSILWQKCGVKQCFPFLGPCCICRQCSGKFLPSWWWSSYSA
jgi:hypothetical protein